MVIDVDLILSDYSNVDWDVGIAHNLYVVDHNFIMD